MKHISSILVLTNYFILDRKSTRLNSSHANISYAVFCLKKKEKYAICLDHWKDRVYLYGLTRQQPIEHPHVSGLDRPCQRLSELTTVLGSQGRLRYGVYM